MWTNVPASLVSMVVYAITWRMILVVPVLMTMLGEAATEVYKYNILNIVNLNEENIIIKEALCGVNLESFAFYFHFLFGCDCKCLAYKGFVPMFNSFFSPLSA